ncbi:MAG: hypothetical protein V7L23_13185 [Nostoc sp.]|uniref:hypothetical protein n=1 Tax=Nostoc sp. TaxID=1180 RepID=UPI002FF0B65C
MLEAKTRSSKYYGPAFLALAGLGVLAAPMLLSLPWQVGEIAATGKETSDGRVERVKIEEQGKMAETYRKAETMPMGRSVIISNFVDRGKRKPKLSKEYLSNLGKDEKIMVYDATKKCIGLIQSRKFTWKGEVGKSKICENLQQDDK